MVGMIWYNSSMNRRLAWVLAWVEMEGLHLEGSLLYTSQLLDLQHSIAAGLFDGVAYPWEALPKIKAFAEALGRGLGAGYREIAPGVWAHETAKIAATASIEGPCVIDEGAEIRHCAYIRGSAIVGKGAVVGNSTELKNCVIFDGAQVPHYNYVGDSVLGYKAHMGAGSILSNVKADKKNIVVKAEGILIETGLRKFGAVLGDGAEIGCNAVLNPGTVIGRRGQVYPTSSVRGVVPEDCIYKGKDEMVRRT